MSRDPDWSDITRLAKDADAISLEMAIRATQRNADEVYALYQRMNQKILNMRDALDQIEAKLKERYLGKVSK